MRDAPGTPEEFLKGLINSTMYSNQTVMIDPMVAMGDVCMTSSYNFSAHFPECDLDCGFEYCVTVDCLYWNYSPSNLRSLCDPGFLALLGGRSCLYGSLNNFQV